MSEQAKQNRDYRVLMGLVMGGAVGAGLAMWLAPRAVAEIKARAVDSAKAFGDAVSERYRDARFRVTDAVDGLTSQGQGLRDGACDTVVRVAKPLPLAGESVDRIC